MGIEVGPSTRLPLPPYRDAHRQFTSPWFVNRYFRDKAMINFVFPHNPVEKDTGGKYSHSPFRHFCTVISLFSRSQSENQLLSVTIYTFGGSNRQIAVLADASFPQIFIQLWADLKSLVH